MFSVSESLVDSTRDNPEGHEQVFKPGSRVCLRQQGQVAVDVEIVQPTIMDGRLMYQVKLLQKPGQSPARRWVSGSSVEPSGDADAWEYAWWSRLTETYEEPSDAVRIEIDCPKQENGSDSGQIVQALEELVEIEQEAEEEGLPQISAEAKENARRILIYFARHPVLSTVYPTEDAEIAILFRSCTTPSSVLILLEDSGRAVCISYTNGESRHRRYGNWSDVPDDFVEEQVRVLGNLVSSDSVA